MIITTNQHHICEDNGIMVIVMMIINIDQHYNCGNNCHYSTQSLPWRTVVINHQELSYFLWIAFRLIDENDAQTFWQKWRWQCWWCNRPATQHHPCSSSTWRHISGNYTLWQLIIDLVCLPLSWLPLKTLLMTSQATFFTLQVPNMTFYTMGGVKAWDIQSVVIQVPAAHFCSYLKNPSSWKIRMVTTREMTKS